MTRDGSVPSHFLTPKILQLAKNLVHFSSYHLGLLWELRQTFLLSRGMKISASNFGGPFPIVFRSRKT